MKNRPTKTDDRKKSFDAVVMKNEIQAKLYEQTKDLSSQQLIEFYRNKAKAGPFKRAG